MAKSPANNAAQRVRKKVRKNVADGVAHVHASSSLAMAPGFVLGQVCDIVDLDGPTFLAKDRTPGVEYADGNVWAGPAVWGTGSKSLS